MKNKLVSLSIPIGSYITKEYIDNVYKEACSYPAGSRERTAFINYAKLLERRLERQDK